LFDSTRIGAAHDLVEAGSDVAAIANAGGWKSLMMPNYLHAGIARQAVDDGAVHETEK
jgi:hypothetical protein